MNKLIESEIQKFEALQKNYEDFGADDSEADYVFQLVIARAISNTPVDIDEAIEWELYDEEKCDAVAKELTTQAWRVYKTIQSNAQASDIIELQKYCWRLDVRELSPRDFRSKNEV